MPVGLPEAAFPATTATSESVPPRALVGAVGEVTVVVKSERTVTDDGSDVTPLL